MTSSAPRSQHRTRICRSRCGSGDEDPFQPGIQAFTAALEAAGAELTAKTWPGAHTGDYWRSHWGDYMRFYASALARC
jgi:enterochelin esterase-like enzyme